MNKSKTRFSTLMFILTLILALQGTALFSDSWSPLPDVPYQIGGPNFDMAVSQDGTAYIAFNYVSVQPGTGSQLLFKVCRYDKNLNDWIDIYTASAKTPDQLFSIALNNTGTTLFMAFCDYDYNEKVSVMKYDIAAGSWETVGSRGFSTEPIVTDLDIEIAPDGTAYVCYLNKGKNLFVKKYSSTGWIDAGNLEGMETNYNQSFAEIEINRFNVPYIVYSDKFYDDFFKQKIDRVEIRKLADNKWVSLTEGLNKAIHPINYSIYAAVDSVSLSISSNDNLYVAYTEWLGYFLPYVKKFTGTSWESIGDIQGDLAKAGTFSLSYKQLMPLGFQVTSQEQIYTAMVGQKKDSPITEPTVFVMTYDTVNQSGWMQVGPANSFDDKAPIKSPAQLALDMFGVPYICYYDDSNPTMLTIRVKKLIKD